MSEPRNTLGERIASLEATVAAGQSAVAVELSHMRETLTTLLATQRDSINENRAAIGRLNDRVGAVERQQAAWKNRAIGLALGTGAATGSVVTLLGKLIA